MSIQSANQWLEVEAINQEMHELVVSCKEESLPAGNEVEQAWQTIAALDKKRMRLLENYINSVDVYAMPQVVEQQLHELLKDNLEMVENCRQLQSKIAAEISQLGQRKRATSAYNLTDQF